MFNWLRRKNVTPITFAQLVEHFKAKWFGDNYAAYAKEAYAKNVIAYHCISKISKAVAAADYIVSIKGKEIEDTRNPLVKALKRPNPVQSYKNFMQQAIAYRLISGNVYIRIIPLDISGKFNFELLRPDRVSIRVMNNIPQAYEYTINGETQIFPIGPLGESEILHIKEFNPLCDLYGLSPISAAAMSIGQHNESGEWNKKLLENSARPPGIITIKAGNQLTGISKQGMQDLREDFAKNYFGSKNAGKPVLISQEVDWLQMGMSPADMDWLNARSTTARDICLAFNYPAFLLGMPEGSTFNNVDSAKLALYEETVVPMANDTLEAIAHHLSSYTGQEIEIYVDTDQISALAPRRAEARKTAREDTLAGIISPNEARAESGYDPVDGGDVVLIPAGKLPINFDPGDFSGNPESAQQKYKNLLMYQGYSEQKAVKMAQIAYQGGDSR